MRDVNLIPALCSARKGHNLPSTESLPTHLILIDGSTQPRAGLRQEVIDEYAEAMMEGAVFPPVTVFFDGEQHWLTDGFHRLAAVKQIGQPSTLVDVRPGTRREAVLHSVGANACHGLRRSNVDKRRAAETLLTDPEWQQWSDREIAKQCCVSKTFVSHLRQEMNLTGNGCQSKNFTNTPDQEDVPQPNLRRGADGRMINTTNIGRRKASTFTNEEDNGATTSVKALPPFLPASPQGEISPPPVTTDVCAEAVPTSGSDSEVSQPKVLLEESREPDPQPQPALTTVRSASHNVLPHLAQDSARSDSSFSPVVIDIPAETISVQEPTLPSSQEKQGLPNQQRFSITTEQPHESQKRLTSAHPDGLTRKIRALTLVELAKNEHPKKTLIAQINVCNIDWHEPRLLDNAQTLEIPLCLWVEGPSYVLPALLRQIRENPDIRSLMFSEFSNLFKVLAELVA